VKLRSNRSRALAHVGKPPLAAQLQRYPHFLWISMCVKHEYIAPTRMLAALALPCPSMWHLDDVYCDLGLARRTLGRHFSKASGHFLSSSPNLEPLVVSSWGRIDVSDVAGAICSIAKPSARLRPGHRWLR
jgi:hypothetical protein